MYKTVNKSMIFGTKKTCKNVPRPNNRFSWVWNLKNLKIGFEILFFLKKYIKDAPKQTVQNGSYTSPNELMRFPNEAKPIWVKIQKHCKNAVTI